MNYKRLTNNNRDEYDPEYDFCCDCKYFGEPCGCNRQNGACGNYNRFLEIYNYLAKLEDKIEKGLLVPRYSILKDWQYGWWCVCEVDEQSRIIAQCETEEEAKQKLKELMENDIEYCIGKKEQLFTIGNSISNQDLVCNNCERILFIGKKLGNVAEVDANKIDKIDFIEVNGIKFKKI